MHLTPEQLYERTGYKNRKKQCVELARQGVEFKVRWDGFPLVLLSQFDATPAGKRKKEPDYKAADRMTQ